MPTICDGFTSSSLDTIKATVRYMSPTLKDKEVKSISKAIATNAIKYNIDWRIMTSIISQESRFRTDPQNCIVKKHCPDLGMAQINYRTWKEPLNLNRNKLLTDINYNIGTMSKILSQLHNKYGKDKHWFTRYHSFSNDRRIIYQKHIHRQFMQISSYSHGYSDGNWRRK
jgi:soluble lytic murein transglycosylase-like protein